MLRIIVQRKTFSAIFKNQISVHNFAIKKQPPTNKITVDGYKPFLSKSSTGLEVDSASQSQEKPKKLWQSSKQDTKNPSVQFRKQINNFFLQGKQKEQEKEIKQKRNLQFYFLYSQFHKNGMEPDKFYQILDKILENKSTFVEQKKKLREIFKQLIAERQQLVLHNFSHQWFSEEYKKFEKNEPSMIQHYFILYRELYSLMGLIFEVFLKQNGFKNIDKHLIFLDLTVCIRHADSFKFYCSKAIETEFIKQNNFFPRYSLFINAIYQGIQASMELSTLDSHPLSKELSQFYSHRLSKILKQSKKLPEQISLLQKIETIYKKCSISPEKQQFYIDFMTQTLTFYSQRLNETYSSDQENDFNAFSKLTLLFAKSQVFQPKTIASINSLLIKIVENQKLNFTQSIKNNIMRFYATVGQIPEILLQKIILPYLMILINSKNTQKLYFSIKFIAYSDCRVDVSLVLKIFTILSSIKLSDFGRKNNNDMQTLKQLHKVSHYLCIKYPELKTHPNPLKMLNTCYSHNQKDTNFIKKIIQSFQNRSKIAETASNQFLSPCITNQNPQNTRSEEHGLHKMQESIVAVNIESIINQLNKFSKGAYELKRNVSFCVYQIDAVVIKWNSKQKQFVEKYLAIETVGIQYCFDTNTQNISIQDQKKAHGQVEKILYQKSLIEYEKGLMFSRKKYIKQQILEHYGWKILHVPTKYTSTKMMDRNNLRQKLRQGILSKFAQK